MSREPFSVDRFNSELEVLGEQQVRQLRANGRWGDANSTSRLVDHWLEEKDRARIDASTSEQRRIDRSANTTAMVAAIAAVIAAVMATIGAIISLLAYLGPL